MRIDETFKDKGVLLEYEDGNNKAILVNKDNKKFIKEFPNKKFLFDRILQTDRNRFKIIDIKNVKPPIDKYIQLEKLDELFEKIAIDRQPGRGRSYKYELFFTTKIFVQNSIDWEHLQKVTDEIIDSIDKFYGKFSNNSANMELEKKFILKAMEDIFKDKLARMENRSYIDISFNDLIDRWQELCEEYETIQRAYIESLDTQKIKFDFEKKTQEINEKLHSILADIQTKIIIPPLALLLVFANIYDKTPVVKGVTMCLLAIFFIVITWYGYMQYQFLEVYLKKIEHWERFYKKHMGKSFTLQKKNFNTLYSLANNIKYAIFFPLLLSWVAFTIAISFLF